jgi:hypothetical protein
MMENRQKGKWSATTLAKYSQTVKRDAPEIQVKRQAKKCLV